MPSSTAGVVRKSTSTTESTLSSPVESGAEPQLPPAPPLSSGQITTNNVPSEAVLNLMEIFRALKEGTRTEQPPWDKHCLLREEYTELLERLDEDEDLGGWVDDKLRYDYDSETQQLIIRMNTLLHEKFIVNVVRRIKTQVTAIATPQPQLREVIDPIQEEGSWRLRLGSIDDSENEHECGGKAYHSSRSADQVFRYQGAAWPSVVLEASYAQKRKDLPKIAYSYIRGSGGHITAVVGLDVECTPPKKQSKTKVATVSVWRFKPLKDKEGVDVGACVQVVKDELPNYTAWQIFRSDDGKSTQGYLAFSLGDFHPFEIVKNVIQSNRDLPIAFPFEHLASDLEKAEREFALVENRREMLPPVTNKWRKRERSLVEELDAEGERKYQALEQTEAGKASERDSGYSPGHAMLQPVEAARSKSMPRRRRSRHGRTVLEDHDACRAASDRAESEVAEVPRTMPQRRRSVQNTQSNSSP